MKLLSVFGLVLVYILFESASGNAQGSWSPIRPAIRTTDVEEAPLNEFVELRDKYQTIDLSLGYPDYFPPHFIVEALDNLIDPNDTSSWPVHGYTESPGLPRLTNAIVTYYNEFRSFNQLRDPKEQVQVTVGGREAIYASILAFVNPGDEVIIMEPAYDGYNISVQMAQGVAVVVPLRLQLEDSETDSPLTSASFKLDMQELEHKISNKTKILVLNTPNNPTGKVFSQSELEEIAKLCTKYNLLVLADEVYEHIYYSPSEPHISIATLPGMWERTLTIGSASKGLSVPGWRIGWVFGPSELIKYVKLVHDASVLQAATPMQEAVAQYFEHEMSLMRANKTTFWEANLRQTLLKKRNRIADILTRAQMRPILPQGSYYIVANFSILAQKHPEYEQGGQVEGKMNTKDYRFARWMAMEKKLQVLPLGAFYSGKNHNRTQDIIRFCFIKEDKTLDQVEAILEDLLQSH